MSENELNNQEALSIINLILNKQLNPIEGFRKLIKYSAELGLANQDAFMPILAMVSETDHWPLGVDPSFLSKPYLKKMRKEQEEYLASAEQDILKACQEITKLLGSLH